MDTSRAKTGWIDIGFEISAIAATLVFEILHGLAAILVTAVFIALFRMLF